MCARAHTDTHTNFEATSKQGGVAWLHLVSQRQRGHRPGLRLGLAWCTKPGDQPAATVNKAPSGPGAAFSSPWEKEEVQACKGVPAFSPDDLELSLCFSFPPPRKAMEGLLALSEDGCSPISIEQMAYGTFPKGRLRGAWAKKVV